MRRFIAVVVAVLLVGSGSAESSPSLRFTNNVTSAGLTAPGGSGGEFQFLDTDGNPFDGTKSLIDTGTTVTWTFDAAGNLTAIAGAVPTPAVNNGPGPMPGAFNQNLLFLSSPWGFVSPLAGSAAGATLAIAGNVVTLTIPVFEVHWTTEDMDITDVVLNGTLTDGSFLLTGSHAFVAAQDVVPPSFGNFAVEWALTGTVIPEAIPEPGAIALVGSALVGLIGLTRWRGLGGDVAPPVG